MKVYKIIFSAFGIIIIGSFILLTTTIFSPEVSNYFSRIEFDSEKWKNWEESENEPSLRWNMVHDLRKKHELVGMNKIEIIELLGKPDSKNEEYISYQLGMSGHMIDAGILYIELKKEIVDEVKVWHG